LRTSKNTVMLLFPQLVQVVFNAWLIRSILCLVV
jgi:hypothetical protein